ncbi:MAG: serine/threonine-protein kinase, partial [Chitinispirillia bacterium]
MYTSKKNHIQTLELLHKGRYSDIYLDRENFDKPAVIKILHKNICSVMQRYKLHRELEISKRITHNNIREVYGAAIIENRDSLIMEYVKGQTIYQAFIYKSRGIIDMLKTAISIIRALNNLHTANIAHNCITPSNILVSDKDNVIKFIDFGYALNIKNRNESDFNPEISEDSVKYMSPEQTGKLNRVVDYRTDFYSLGVLFYEMFAGVPPFSGESAEETVHYHIAKDPLPIYKLNPEIPHVLSDIIGKLLSKNAGDRYQSAIGIESDLIKVLNLF